MSINYGAILGEVHEELPKQLRRVNYLWEKKESVLYLFLEIFVSLNVKHFYSLCRYGTDLMGVDALLKLKQHKKAEYLNFTIECVDYVKGACKINREAIKSYKTISNKLNPNNSVKSFFNGNEKQAIDYIISKSDYIIFVGVKKSEFRNYVENKAKQEGKDFFYYPAFC